jgi:hypothetical protein
VSLGYELDPADNRGFALLVPAYLVVEEAFRKIGDVYDATNFYQTIWPQGSTEPV